jgi:hypothetical protein
LLAVDESEEVGAIGLGYLDKSLAYCARCDVGQDELTAFEAGHLDEGVLGSDNKLNQSDSVLRLQSLLLRNDKSLRLAYVCLRSSIKKDNNTLTDFECPT